jgi:hypothetical protein
VHVVTGRFGRIVVQITRLRDGTFEVWVGPGPRPPRSSVETLQQAFSLAIRLVRYRVRSRLKWAQQDAEAAARMSAPPPYTPPDEGEGEDDDER